MHKLDVHPNMYWNVHLSMPMLYVWDAYSNVYLNSYLPLTSATRHTETLFKSTSKARLWHKRNLSSFLNIISYFVNLYNKI